MTETPTHTPLPFYSVDAQDPTLQEKFWNRVDKAGPNECWLWTGAITQKGYGSFSAGRQPMPAHRFSYHLHNPDMDHSLVVDHICRNRACVNPNHLRLTTNRENVLCGVGPSASNARKTHCPRGHAYVGQNIQTNRSGERICKECRRIRRARYYYADRDRAALKEAKNG